MKKQTNNLYNKLINTKLEIAYQYLEFSNFFYTKNLNGYSSNFRLKAKEEIDQAILIIEFMKKSNIDIELLVIKAPLIEYEDIFKIFKTCIRLQVNLKSDLKVLLNSKSDYVFKVFLQWLIDIQTNKLNDLKKMIIDYELNKNKLSILNDKYMTRKGEANEILSM